MLRGLIYLLASIFLIAIIRAVVGIIGKAVNELVNPQDAQPASGGGSSSTVKAGGELKKDPVCGTYISTHSPHRKTVRGETVYFCSEACKNKHTG